MEAYEELRNLVDALNAAEVDYALCGGLAVVVYGYARMTKDIDILVLEDDLERVKELAGACGFTIESGLIRFEVGTEQEQRIYRLLKVIEEEILMLDLVLAGPSLADVWQDRETAEWGDRQVQIVSANGLTKMKMRAGRPQDIVDLTELGFLDDEGSPR